MKLRLSILDPLRLLARLSLLRQSNLVLQSRQIVYPQLQLARRARLVLGLRQLLQQMQRSLDTHLEQQLPVLVDLLGLLLMRLLVLLAQ
jgi:hypothetical protein